MTYTRATHKAIGLLLLGTLSAGCPTEDDDPPGPAQQVGPTVVYLHEGLTGPGPALVTSNVDATGKVDIVTERRSSPFGQPVDARATTGVSSNILQSNFHTREPLGMLNKEHDRETGYSFHGARWMAPQFAQWLSADPPVKAPNPDFMTRPWDLNPYQYGRQNPVMYWDPDGRDAKVTFARSFATNPATGKVVEQPTRVTVSTTIYVYGSGATQSTIATMERNIMSSWNRPGGWSYQDKASGHSFNVTFAVKVRAYNPKAPTNNPLVIPESWNPTNTDNFIEIGATAQNVARSHVFGGDEGS
ncbi:uncharacterized protein METZ01_LOCUS311733, partial [marine metagenome]